MILITRPQPEAGELAQILEDMGFNCLVEPMIEIKFLKPDLEQYFNKSVQAFLTTSKNARKFIPRFYAHASIPEQGRNAHDLSRWIIKHLKPEDGKIIYLRGDIISFDISAELRQHDFNIAEVVVYESHPVTHFSENFMKNIGKISLATFFSARTISNFLTLVDISKLGKKLKNIDILCMSQEIADRLKFHQCRAVHISEEPTLNAMINKIDEIY